METPEQKVVLPRIIQSIIELAENHDFNGAGPKEAIGKGEKVFFEMTPWEKACYVYRDMTLGQAKQKVQEGVPEESGEVQSLLSQRELANKLLWCSIRERLSDGGPRDIGIRAGWQVVEAKAECDCIACQMRRAGIGGVHVIGIGLPAPRSRGILASLFGR